MKAKESSRILLAGNEILRDVFEGNPAVMLMIDPNSGAIVDTNAAAVQYLGYSRECLQGLSIAKVDTILSSELAKACRCVSLREPRVLEGSCRLASGEMRAVEILLTPVDFDGKALFFSIIQDVTESQKVKTALTISEARYRAAFESGLDGLSISDLNTGTYVDANPAFLRIFGYERIEVVGRSSLDLGVWVDPGDRQRIVEIMQEGTQCRNVQARFRKKNGDLFWGLVSVTKIEVDGIPQLLFALRDTTESKEAERRIANLAFFDQLTGLPNRSLLFDRLHVAKVSNARRKQFFGLLLVDFDNFRAINDTLGFGHGDSLLTKMAEQLMGCVRAEDTVARLGGDEFAILITGLGHNEDDAVARLEKTGQKILSAMRRPWCLDGKANDGTVSIGISLSNRCHADSRSMLKQAEIAMYRSKSDGGDCLRFFNSEMEQRLLARTALLQELKDGIEENQFVLMYQPQVSNDRVVGAEALVRWQHPVKGLISPADFIPLAEETGAIIVLGDWILREVCNRLVMWSHDPLLSPLTISMNVSARQFQHPDFVERTVSILDASRVPADRLKIELTECTLFSNIDEIRRRMGALKEKGVAFSLDDFGTGFSSLSHLKKLPINQLKIDRTFVSDMLDSDNDVAIVKSIISLGTGLGLEVIAEGVETQGQRSFLGNLGCAAYQGYLFSRPLPEGAFEEYVARNALFGLDGYEWHRAA